ncbi:hypothetical protein Mapa_014174 [Marchantia paleacea]|nr:hypothetical protein Mapa_014174 [Marchantia paleacea]
MISRSNIPKLYTSLFVVNFCLNKYLDSVLNSYSMAQKERIRSADKLIVSFRTMSCLLDCCRFRSFKRVKYQISRMITSCSVDSNIVLPA